MLNVWALPLLINVYMSIYLHVDQVGRFRRSKFNNISFKLFRDILNSTSGIPYPFRMSDH